MATLSSPRCCCSRSCPSHPTPPGRFIFGATADEVPSLRMKLRYTSDSSAIKADPKFVAVLEDLRAGKFGGADLVNPLLGGLEAAHDYYLVGYDFNSCTWLCGCVGLPVLLSRPVLCCAARSLTTALLIVCVQTARRRRLWMQRSWTKRPGPSRASSARPAWASSARIARKSSNHFVLYKATHNAHHLQPSRPRLPPALPSMRAIFGAWHPLAAPSLAPTRPQA